MDIKKFFRVSRFKKPVPIPVLPIEQLFGIYRGFGPTLNHTTLMGELEVNLQSSAIHVRAAIGGETYAFSFDKPKYKLIPREALNCENLERTVGYMVGDVAFLFIDKPKQEEFALTIRNLGIADDVAPTVCYNPDQVLHGIHERTLRRHIAAAGSFGFPTLPYK